MLETLDYKWALALLSALISICNVSFYLKAILNGKVKPHMYTWIIWGMVAGTVAAGQIFDGASAGAGVAVIAALNCSAIVVLSFSYGSKDITKSDKICLIGCLIALLLWPLTNSPLWSIIIVTIIDLTGYIPTMRKSFKAPHQESIYIFSIFLVTTTLGLFALHNYTFITTIYLIAMNIANTGMLLFLLIRRKQLGYKVFA